MLADTPWLVKFGDDRSDRGVMCGQRQSRLVDLPLKVDTHRASNNSQESGHANQRQRSTPCSTLTLSTAT